MTEPDIAAVASVLPESWYELTIAPGVDPNLPGLYVWVIEGGETYVGKYTRRSGPFREYERNVLKILNGRPYPPRKPEAFRRIHRALHDAYKQGKKIELRIVENCAPADLDRRERALIAQIGTLNG